MKPPALRLVVSVFSFLLLLIISPSAFAQTITVTSATPSAAPQGTINLNVAIRGNGFKKGARAIFYLSGTTNTDGVTVNSTALNGNTQVTANINVSDTASINSFDVVVQNADGRSGKGTKLFQVTAKGTPVGCTTLGTPSGFTLVTTLNYVNASGAAKYTRSLGFEVRVRPVTSEWEGQSRTLLVAAVGSFGSGTMEFFVLDPATGNVQDGQSLFPGGPVQPHITVAYAAPANDGSVTAGAIAAGDLNADDIPDFVIGNGNGNFAIAFVGSVTNGILGYRVVPIPLPASNSGAFGASVAMGDLDGPSGDAVAVGDSGSGTGHKVKPGKVFMFKFNGSGFDSIGAPLVSPAGGRDYGTSIAIGDVSGDGAPDLVVGAVANSAVYVYPAPLSSSLSYTLSDGSGADGLGKQVGVGFLSSSNATDVVAATWTSGSVIEVAAFAGPITASRTNASFRFLPFSGLSSAGWASGFDVADMDGDGRVEVIVGLPNSSNSTSCNVSVGAAEAYFSNVANPSQPILVPFQPPIVSSFYGWGIGGVPASLGNPVLLLVGERGTTIGSTTNAGQVYVYKKN